MNYMLTTIYILSAVIIICTFVIYNLLMKQERLESLVTSRELFITLMNGQLQFAITKIEELDKMGIYRYNEEIGTFFDEIVECSKSITQIIGGYSDQQQ